VAAASLAASGHAVVLLDRGGETPPGPLLVDHQALEVLEPIGWSDLVEKQPSAVRADRLEIVGEHERHTLGDGWDLWAVSGRLIIEEMRRRASRHGVTWIAGLSAVGPIWTDRRVSGVRARDARGGERQFRARLVIDASGPDAFLATALGLRLPRRGEPRPRWSAVLTGDDAPEGHTLTLVRDAWITSARIHGEAVAAAVLRPHDDGPGDHDGSVAEAFRSAGGRIEQQRLAHRSVGATLLSQAGDGWIAVGEASGCGAPGSPGVTSAGLRLAASAAWEADLALSGGAPVSPRDLGITVTLARRDAQLGPLLDRALMRASRSGVLGWAFETRWRRRRLRDVLRGDWTPDARFGRGWFLWRLDRISRRAARASEVR
jgi:hypothetical protein